MKHNLPVSCNIQYSYFSIYEPTHVSLHASMRWDASSNNVMGHCCQNSEKCWAAPDMTDKYQHPMVKTASFWLWRRQWGCFLPTWSKYSITLLAQVDCGFPWHAMSPDWKYKLYIITVQDARRLADDRDVSLSHDGRIMKYISITHSLSFTRY